MPSHELWLSLMWALAGALLGRAFLPAAQRLSRTAQRSVPALSSVVVTLVTAILFGLLAWRVGVRGELLAFSCVALAGVPLAAVDLTELRLPTPLVYFACLATFGLFTLAAAVDQAGQALLRGVAGMVLLPTAYLAVALVSRGGFGAGDIRLAALVGLALGWRSWSAMATGTVVALALASTVGLVAIASGRLSRRSPLPYGPAMIAGAFTAVLT